MTMTAPYPVVPDHADTRAAAPAAATERQILDATLEFYRSTVFLKVAGLDGEQLARRAVEPSTLSLLGIVRHLTEVEAYWLRVVLDGEQHVPDYYCTKDRPDGDFLDASAHTAALDLAMYRLELDRCREVAGRWSDLEAASRGHRRGDPVSVRWVLNHLINEYSRHVGHMDLLREVIDGRTGA